MTERHETRAITHADDCWSWGPKHYECALREIGRLVAELREMNIERLRLRDEMDALARENEAMKRCVATFNALAGEAARPIEILTPVKPTSEWIEWDPYTATGFPEVPEGMRIAWYRLQNGYEEMCRNPRMLDWGPRSPRDTQIVAYKLEPVTFVATAALAQQPASVGEEIMVNAAHDVYTLPLQPSGLSSGPRFVVHVPAPEQKPASPSGAVNVVGMPEFDDLMDHIYEYGTTAEGVVERANAFARAVLAQYAPQQPAGRVHDLAARLVDELDGLVGESYGVSGLHLNGDVAPWDDLLPGGRFERLSSLDELRAAFAAKQQGGAS